MIDMRLVTGYASRRCSDTHLGITSTLVFWNKEVDQDEPNEPESGEEKGGLDSPPCTVPIGKEH